VKPVTSAPWLGGGALRYHAVMSSPAPSPRQTLGAPADDHPLPSVAAIGHTLLGIAPSAPSPVDLGETIGLPEITGAPGLGSAPDGQAAGSATAAGRTTVLPRRRASGEAPLVEGRPRFDRVRLLGEGGMGEVELARDNDIRRTVALKRLHSNLSSAEALLRFADEVRIIGQLEHPAIVPIYDVGRDEDGQVYLVMKHLSGETMDCIIERLAAGDPDYQARFSLTQRIHLFLAILDAIRYAHARGVIHRDLKPANIMIGPYGEVTVLDWGIAKVLHQPAGVEPAQALERTAVDTADRGREQTVLGSLAGTPLYMSPEQAAGRNDQVDQRSDVFALCMLLQEWLALEHPLRHKTTVTEVLAAIISEDCMAAIESSATRQGVPAELLKIIERGLVKDPEKRLQSVAELERELKRALAGHVRVECPVTLTKRVLYAFLHWIDHNPGKYVLLLMTTILLLLGSLGYGVYRALGS
jgi:eukaryotic-like serine/threonine-protein kinase